MYPSIATVCLSGTLTEKVQAIAAAGYQHIEIFDNDLITHDGSVADAARLIKDHGLKVVTLQPFRDFEGLSGKDRQLAFDRAERKFDQMAILDTDLLMLCSSCHPNAKPGLSRAADDLAELGERAASHSVKVAYEALAWGKYIWDYRDSWEIVRRANHASVGLVLDTFHIFSRGTDLTPIAQIPGEKIFLVQTADAPRLSMDHLSWSRHYRCFPGQGELDIAAFMYQLQQTGYDGAVSHEIFNDIFRMSPPAQTAIDGFRSSRYLETMLPSNQALVPPKQMLHGYEFIEICAEPQHLQSLQTLLMTLGFAHIGNHKTMLAEHWQSGAVNIVLNTDQAFADHYQLKHGTSVAAIGIKLDNAYAAIKRARFLELPLIEPHSVDSVHHMTGLQSADGSVWYLLDQSTADQAFDSAFNPTSGQAANVEYIRSIDHISLSQHYPDFLSTVFAFRSLFDLEPSPSFDVTDPRGLIQSQVLSDEQQAFRLALNASLGSQTTSRQFIEQTHGSSVQHIALQSTNLVGLAAALNTSDIKTLPIPENYYLDLQSKFGLSAERVAQYQALNILYDEDEHGHFLQLYLLPIGGHFYLEIVERNGYQGMGAPNAFVRAAAQQRKTTT